MKGWRTIGANVLALLPLLADITVQLMTDPIVSDVVPDTWLPYYGVVLGVINLYLRFITTTPVGRKA